MSIPTRLGPLGITLVAAAGTAIVALIWFGLASRSTGDPGKDRLMEDARVLHAAGDFEQARRTLAPVLANDDAPLEAVRGMAELEYLLGDYSAAEELLYQVVERAGAGVEVRADAEAALTLTHYQTGEYDKADGLFAGLEDAIELPLWELMTQVEGPPYQTDWSGLARIELPFLQTTEYDLPRVMVSANGRDLEATIDTGGDLFTLPSTAAAELGIEPVTTFEGTFAGGVTAQYGYAILDELRLGQLTLHNVPITIGAQDTAVIGTGLLRQFLPTLDYPGSQLVLQPRGSESAVDGATEIPFTLALTHVIVAKGSLDATPDLTYMVDSGLLDSDGASFIAPAATLELANIPIPEPQTVVGESGAGETTLDIGRFSIERLGLGPLALEGTTGLHGVFPAELGGEATGFVIHGSISHHFLRHYSWTIDFDRMVMVFTTK
ncbi:MAG: hypothetical protein GY722_19505 [bacterium]|nr:hypothetical protein [bacterium]